MKIQVKYQPFGKLANSESEIIFANMEKNETLNKVADIIRKSVKQARLEITTDTSSSDVKGWDSLQHMMILTEIENEFSIKFDFLEILEMKSVGDICNAISEHK